jgi:alkylhydroperoxidase family enzyme
MSATALSSEHGQLPLPPVDRPASWFARLLFWAFRRRYGFTPTAFRVVYARSPFLGVVSLVIITGMTRFLRLPHELAALVAVSLDMRNGCTFCADLGLAEAARSRIGMARFRERLAFEQSDSFTEREKAALAYVKALHESLHIPDAVWAQLGTHFSERERIDLVWICAVEQYFNSMALPLRVGSDNLAGRSSEREHLGRAQAGEPLVANGERDQRQRGRDEHAQHHDPA